MKRILPLSIVLLGTMVLCSSCEALLEGLAATSQQNSMYSNFWNNAGAIEANSPANGTVKTSRKQVSCTVCNGQGFTSSNLTYSGKVRCGYCHGKGVVTSYE